MNKLWKILLVVITPLILLQISYATEEVTGSGSSFISPLFAKWTSLYEKESKEKINYMSVGSGAGINQIEAKQLEFGASDMPLLADELHKENLFQFPAIIGGVVVIYNLKGIKTNELQLTGEVLADVFLGKITKWNDPKIVAINPNVKLPNLNITVIHRSDGSGTTFIFTDYLSKLSPEWKKTVGSYTSVQWPVGIGGRGNEGISLFADRSEGSIGYVEYAFAKQSNQSTARLKNKDGFFIAPSSATFAEAASKVNWEQAKNFYIILTNQPGAKSWPITGVTYILMHKTALKPEMTLSALRFFKWAFDHDDIAKGLDYVTLPKNLKIDILNAWSTELKTTDGKPVWKN